MFVPDFLCSKTIGRPSSHSQSQKDKSFPSRSKVSDGNVMFHSSSVIEPRLGSFDRFKRCLFSCSDSQVVQASPRFSVSGSSVPVCSASVRSQGLSLGLHESGSDGSRVSSQTRSSHVLLPRRLAYSSGVEKSSFGSSFSCVTKGTGSGVPDKLEEVVIRPSEGTCLFGSDFGHSEEISATSGTQSFGTSKSGARVSIGSSFDGSEVAGFSGSPCKHGGFSSALQTTDETPSDLLPSIFLSDKRQSGKVDSVIRGNQGSCFGLGVAEPSVGRKTVCSETTRDYGDDGCVGLGLGSSVSHASSFRSMVSAGSKKPHQPVGVEGCGFSSPRFRTSGGGPVGSDSVRQQDCRGVHKSTRGYPFDSSMYDGSVVMGVVHPETNSFVGCSHSGDRECSGGFSFKGKFIAQRVDVEQGSVSQDLSQSSSSFGDRPICVESECSTSKVLLQRERPSSLEDRCSVVPLGGSGAVCLPSFRLDPQGSTEGSKRRGGSSVDCSFLAKKTLVPSSNEVVGGNSEESASSRGSVMSTSVVNKTSECSIPSSYSMAAVRQQAEEAGLSSRAAQFTAEALRESTRLSYDSRLDHFRKWCDQNDCDPITASLGKVADFLIYLFDKNLALSTIRSYRSAIASCHRGFSDGSSVSNSSFLSKICRSFLLKRPPVKSLTPAWSLPSVLKVLMQAPFEPLATTSLRNLTLKTVFLVAVASGHRVSTLGALCLDRGHIRWEPSGVRLIPKPGFLAKNQGVSSPVVEIFLPKISSFSAVEDDKLWCPVRALKWYVNRTEKFRSSSSLFVATVAPFGAVSSVTLSKWLVECIKMAGPEAIFADKIRAHDTRALSTSWALFNGASVTDIVKAAYWSNANTFIACYLKDVVSREGLFGRAALATSGPPGSSSSAH